jgi:SAM-dependent methyltransferase
VVWALGYSFGRDAILDAGCGPGADAVTLAQALPAADITAIDMQDHFVAEAARRLAPFGARARALKCDMLTPPGRYDFIWSAGAVYLEGIENVLPAWAEVLKPHGRAAFSEAVFLTNPPSDAARRFWAGEGEISTESMLKSRVEGAGWRLVDSKLVQGIAWAAYYGPMAARIAKLRGENPSPQLAEILDEGEQEIVNWRAAPQDIAYLLMVVEPE